MQCRRSCGQSSSAWAPQRCWPHPPPDGASHLESYAQASSTPRGVSAWVRVRTRLGSRSGRPPAQNRRNTMKTISRIVALAVTATALVATASPAQAVGESTASTTTAYVGDNCINHPVNYSVALPADAQSWFMEIQAIYPDGTEG